MKRGGPVARRTPLRAGTALRRTGFASRTPSERQAGPGFGVRRQPPARRAPLRRVSKKRAALIRERRAMLLIKYPGITLCEVPYCNRVADDAHEPLTRARGGSITDAVNVKAVCRPHHDEVTFEEPKWAYDLGFLVHSWDGAA